MIAKHKIADCIKHFHSRYRTKNGTDAPAEETNREKARLSLEYGFNTFWFPPEWLAWFVYGPPLAKNRTEFSKLQMPHLVQVLSAPAPLTREEVLKEILPSP